MSNIESLKMDLWKLGLKAGDAVVLHASLKGLQMPGITPDDVIKALLEVLTPSGTLLMPAFSYRTVTDDYPVFHAKKTVSCVGAVAERFRMEYASYRSIHPTHSFCASGKYAYPVTAWHSLDHTPVGVHSPVMQLPKLSGKILMLGCGLSANAFLLGVEESAKASYALAQKPVLYTLTDDRGKTWKQSYYPRNYAPIVLHYERLADILNEEELIHGKALNGSAYLIDAAAAFKKGQAKIREDENFFADRSRLNFLR